MKIFSHIMFVFSSSSLRVLSLFSLALLDILLYVLSSRSPETQASGQREYPVLHSVLITRLSPRDTRVLLSEAD